MDKKATLVRQHDLAEPHPVLGYSDVTSSALWDKCLLKSVLLDRHQVWGSAVKVVAGESAARTAVVDAEEGGEVNGPAATEGDSKYTPELFNFGLSPPLASTLSSTLPTVASLLPLLGTKLSSTAVVQSRATRAGELEAYKREQLMRIVDLRNASSKGIEVENTRRIVEAFGRAEGDTGSPEVQGEQLFLFSHLPFSCAHADPTCPPPQPPSSPLASTPLPRTSAPNPATCTTVDPSVPSSTNAPRSSSTFARSTCSATSSAWRRLESRRGLSRGRWW